jgi:hypothetical protein
MQSWDMRVPALFAGPGAGIAGATYDFFLVEKENGREGCHTRKGPGAFFMFNSGRFFCAAGFDVEVPD